MEDEDGDDEQQRNDRQVALIADPAEGQDDDSSSDDSDDEEEFGDAIQDFENEEQQEGDEMEYSQRHDDDEAGISNGPSLPSAREHSYLPGNSHPLLVQSPSGGGGDPSSSPRSSRRSMNKNKRARSYDDGSENHYADVADSDEEEDSQQFVNIPVLQLHGVVLFPGMTIPIRLRERALIQFLARQIELCRTTPHLQPQVRIGIMTYVPREQRYRQHPRRPSRAGGRERPVNDQQQRRRRRRFRWVRRWRRSTNDTSSSSGEEEDNGDADSDDMQQDVSPRQRERPAIAKHPLVGRIGTIATVAYTHELAALDNPSLETSIDSSQQIFRDHGNDNELVVTAIGTNRFRVVSYVQEDSFADLNVFQVEEILDQALCFPRFGRPSASFPFSQPLQDSNVGNNESTEEDRESVVSIRNPRVARHDQLLWNLSMITAVPYCAYKATWPWKMVDSIVAVLETHEGRDNLPSLRDVFVSGKSNNLNDERTTKELSSQALEPTKFSYTMSYNMPFSDEEKLELLQMDSTVERLRVVYDKVMEYAERECFVFCKGCDTKLAGVTSVFTVGGAEGATSNYGTSLLFTRCRSFTKSRFIGMPLANI